MEVHQYKTNSATHNTNYEKLSLLNYKSLILDYWLNSEVVHLEFFCLYQKILFLQTLQAYNN